LPKRVSVLLRECLWLALLTAGALLVHGYHLGIEDQSIYLPGIEKNLDPALFAKDSALFLPQTRSTFLIQLVATSVRITGVTLEAAVFAWHVLSLFLLLAAARRLACRCFASPEARWGSVALLAAVLTLPVAGTSIYIADQYLHPRTLATASILFALAAVLDRRWFRALCCITLAALVHIQMAFYGALLGLFLGWKAATAHKTEDSGAQPVMAGMLLSFPLMSLFEPGSDAWKEAARIHTSHYLQRWEWYEWLGAIAPLAFFCWFMNLARKSGWQAAAFVAQRVAAFQIFSVAAALMLTLPPRLERLTPYQPMRALQVATLIFVLLSGGFLGQYILKRSLLRWLALFVPLCATMFFAQRQLFPAGEHIELPGRASANAWVRAFLWVKTNTAQEAYFALDPVYIERPGEDQHGFRAISQRGMMADRLKDAGVVTLFPGVASRWQQETRARDNWSSFTQADFLRLREQYGVTWVILEKPIQVPLHCPYQNELVAVCRIDDQAHSHSGMSPT